MSPAGISTNGLPDNCSAKQMPTKCSRGQSHVIGRCAIVRRVWRGMLISPLLPSAILVTSLTSLGCWQHEDATRSARHVCHAPTLSAAQRAQQRRLGSGASAAVVLQADGPEAGPVAPCIHAERHGMRSFLSSKSLANDRTSRSTELSRPAGVFIQILQVQLLSPTVTTCSPSPYSHSPAAYLPQLPPTVLP